MITKSFRKQLETLYSLSAYKATGILLPCKCEPVLEKESNASRLAFKVDIAHQLYNKYKEDSFKFSDKGVTPRLLAQQTATYCHQSEHIKLDIDSFGNMILTPTRHYYEQMLVEICESELMKHTRIQVKGTSEQKEEELPVLYAVCNLSLSILRIIYNLQMICRKKIAMKEISQTKLQKYVDLTSLSESELALFHQSNLVNLKDVQVKVKTPIGRKMDYSNLKSHSLDMSNTKNVISGCLRHQYISFLSKYRLPDSQLILKFGQFFPMIHLDQLKEIYQDNYMQKVKQILQKSLSVQNKIPINLNQETTNTIIPSQLLKECSKDEQLLLILDTLANDHIGQALAYLHSSQNKGKQNRPWLKQLQQTIDIIL